MSPSAQNVVIPRSVGFGLESGYADAKTRWTPTGRETSILQFLQAFIHPDDTATYKEHFERVWYQCVAMYEGLQYTYWNAQRQALRQIPKPPWQRRVTVNKILPATERAIAMVGGMSRRPVVTPALPEKKYRDAARMATKVWEAFEQDRIWNDCRRNALKLGAVTGNGFTKVVWDTTRGRIRARSLSGGPVVREGDVRVESVGPWSIFFDPLVTSLEDSGWLRQSNIRSIDWVRTHFPDRGKYVTPDHGGKSWRAWRERRLLNLSGRGGGVSGATGDTRQMERSVQVDEIWVRSGIFDKFPNGLHAIVANGVLLNPANKYENEYVGMDDYGFLEIPYFHFPWYKGINRAWGTGLVEILIPIQSEINLRESQIAEFIDLTTHAPWLVPFNSGTPESAFSNRPDAHIPYDANFPKPERSPVPSLPAQVFVSTQQLQGHFQETAAQHDVTQGKVPEGGRTGIMIQLLQDQDDSVLAEVRSNWNAFEENIGKAVLLLYQKLASTRRVSKIAGLNGQVETFHWSRAEIDGAEDLRFDTDDALGNTPTVQRAVLQDWIQLGLIDTQDPVQKKRIMERMKTSSLDALGWQISLAEREAEDELSQMTEIGEDGMLPPTFPVYPWQDHDTHYRVKNEYRMTAEYKMLPEIVRQSLDANIEAHALFIAQAVETQNALMNQSRGAPGEKGTPSQPRSPASPDEVKAAQQAGGQKGGMQ